MKSILFYLFLVFISIPAFAEVSQSMELPDSIAEKIRWREVALEGYDLISSPESDRRDRERGVDLTIDAALAGDPVAQNNLGYLTSTGDGNLIIPNADMALYWFSRALGEGYTAAAANILDLHQRRPDMKIPSEELGRAYLLMGDAYAKGTGVIPYSFDKSLENYLSAARLGNQRAIAILKEVLGQFPDALGPLSEEDKELLW